MGVRCVRYNKSTIGSHTIERDSGDNIKIALTLNESCKIINVCDGKRREASPRVGAVTILPPGAHYAQTIVGKASALLFELPWSDVVAWMESDTTFDPARIQIQASLCVTDDALARSLIGLAGGHRLRQEQAWVAAVGQILQAHSNSDAPPDRWVRGGISQIQLSRVIQFIEDRLCDDLSLDDLAAQAGLSKFHFLRAFKSSQGTTPHQYVIDRRIERAMEELLARRRDVEDVAVRSGFNHASHLSRLMKRRFGVTPSEFRRDILLVHRDR